VWVEKIEGKGKGLAGTVSLAGYARFTRDDGTEGRCALVEMCSKLLRGGLTTTPWKEGETVSMT